MLLLTSPIAGWLGWCVWHGGWNERQYWNDLGFWSIGLLISAGLMELLGFGLLVWPLLV
ncbi:MAG: hypothetical protein HC837_06560 [Chloroflexaceae bacterium]|nr:hypothetical protein [Chloroflexaceae bacterium]